MQAFNKRNDSIDFDRVVSLNNGVWWVGFQDKESGLRCNPYLIIEGDEAVLLDGGSRPDFPVVMMKILETGLDPHKISALIYDHYDPDLCGSIPNLEDMIENPELKLVTSGFSQMFIRHYGTRSQFFNIADMGYKFTFKTGRQLEFVTIPYCHNRGSYVVFDPQSKILFSGDMFGTYEKVWTLFYGFPDECSSAGSCVECQNDKSFCRLPGYLDFHRKLMPSSKAVHFALKKLKGIPFEMVAPQHGSILDRSSVDVLIKELESCNDIGIDQVQPEE
jgi:flavorubredoxin